MVLEQHTEPILHDPHTKHGMAFFGDGPDLNGWGKIQYVVRGLPPGRQAWIAEMDYRWQILRATIPTIFRTIGYLIKEQVDLVTEFQTDELIAAAIASKYLEANIPFIAIDPAPRCNLFRRRQSAHGAGVRPLTYGADC
jgi:hypothetical protein